jgi:uncharacterized protein (TIGR02996 family)
MTTETAFLGDIVEHPDEDAPRLIFADWVEDRGESARAAFIRIQCELARIEPGTPRAVQLWAQEQALLARHGKGLAGRMVRRKLKHIGGHPTWMFRRGMIEAIDLSTPRLMRLSDDLYQHVPIRHLRLTQLERLGEITDFRCFDRLTGLELVGNLNTNQRGLKHLCEKASLSRLRSVNLRSPGLTSATWNTLVRSLPDQSLTQLGLSIGTDLAFLARSARLDTILASPALQQLEQLEIVSTGAADRVLADLCQRKNAAPLRELCLQRRTLALHLRPEEHWPIPGTLPSLFGGWPFGATPGEGPSAGLTALLIGLRRLTLRSCAIVGEVALHEILELPALSQLRTLELDSIPTAVPFSCECLSRSHMAGLRTLILSNLRLSDESIAHLMSTPTLSGLTSLDLSSLGLSGKDIQMLVQSPYLGNLRALSLRDNLLRGDLRRLIESDLIEQLSWLDLRNTGMTDEDAHALILRNKSLSSLVMLDLRRNSFLQSSRDRLRQAFGPVVRW